MVAFLVHIILCWTVYPGSTLAGESQNIDNRLLKDVDHQIKVNLDIHEPDSNVLHTGWYYVVDSSDGYKGQLDKSDKTYYVDPTPIVTAKNIASVEIYETSYDGKKYFGLAMRLDKQGTENWSFATKQAEIAQIQLAFILDNSLLQVAKVNAQITGGITALNRGNYSREELEKFKEIIKREI